MSLIFKLIKSKIVTTKKQKMILSVKFESKLKGDSALLNAVIAKTKQWHEQTSIKERLLCILLGIKEPAKCHNCQKTLTMMLSGPRYGTYSKFCGSKCSSVDKTVIEKRKRTNRAKYGHSNVLRSEPVKEKVQRQLDELGVSNFAQLQSSKEKRLSTIEIKYHSLNQFKQIINQTRLTTIANKVTANPKLYKQIQEKRIATNIKRYGVDNVFKNKEIQQKAIDKRVEQFGVQYPLQNLTILKKQQATIDRLYGHQHYHTSQISEVALKCLNDKQWLYDQNHCKNLNGVALAGLLNVVPSTVYRYFQIHDIPFNYHNESSGESEIKRFLVELGIKEIDAQNTTLISPYQLDIVVPEKQIAIEYDGIYWHSELSGRNSRYHLNKTNMCNQKHIRLLHIFQNEWILKQDIVKSRLRAIFGKSSTIFGRKTSIVNLTPSEINHFFDTNHIQGRSHTPINIGLMYQDQLVAAISFASSRYSKKYQYELVRYANLLNTTVVGGAGKLFSHFVRTYNPSSIVSYSDKRWNTGNVYKQLGFTFDHCAAPNYFYFNPKQALILHSRIKFQKHKLSKLLPTFDPTLTEWENMIVNGYDRIWDCGNDVWMWSK